MTSRLARWWASSPTDPYVLSAADPDVAALAERVAPGSSRSALGGYTSLNLHLDLAGLVLRVHARFITQRRVLALRQLRRHVLNAGLVAPEPRSSNGGELLRCRDRVAELETFVPHDVPSECWSTYRWLYAGMGRLHRTLAAYDCDLPRPVDSVWAPPSTLSRWTALVEPAVRRDPLARLVAQQMHRLVRTLRSQWVPVTSLPNHPIHGDFQLGNIGRSSDHQMLYLDFGCAAVRPRIHDLASALAWILRAHQSREGLDAFPWARIPDLTDAYQDAAHTTLSMLERAALGPYSATVPLYLAAMAGYLDDPVAYLHDQRRRDYLDVADYVLSNPDALRG